MTRSKLLNPRPRGGSFLFFFIQLSTTLRFSVKSLIPLLYIPTTVLLTTTCTLSLPCGTFKDTNGGTRIGTAVRGNHPLHTPHRRHRAAAARSDPRRSLRRRQLRVNVL